MYIMCAGIKELAACVGSDLNSSGKVLTLTMETSLSSMSSICDSTSKGQDS